MRTFNGILWICYIKLAVLLLCYTRLLQNGFRCKLYLLCHKLFLTCKWSQFLKQRLISAVKIYLWLMRLLLLFLINMKVLTTTILFLLTMGRPASPYIIIISAQLIPLICCYTIYCSSLTATVAGTGVCSFVMIPVPANMTSFPNELIFGFIFTSIMAPN